MSEAETAFTAEVAGYWLCNVGHFITLELDTYTVFSERL